MITIDEQTKEFIRQNKEFLTPKSLYNLIMPQMLELIDMGLIPKDIKKILERELEIELKDRTFYYYINNLKKEPKKIKANSLKNNSKISTASKNKSPEKNFKDPFEMLKGIR